MPMAGIRGQHIMHSVDLSRNLIGMEVIRLHADEKLCGEAWLGKVGDEVWRILKFNYWSKKTLHNTQYTQLI